MAGFADVPIFFSCSFRPEDAVVTDLVRGVCNALGLASMNVAAGFTSVPPEKAREMIAQSAGLIAVATRRDQLAPSEFSMPAAVREEISIAFGLGKKILILGEAGVRFDGFMNNYGTRLMFDRAELTAAAFIEKLVHSVSTFKQEAVAARDAALHLYANEYVSEVTRNLLSLETNADGSYYWLCALTKRLKFEAPLQREIITTVWPSVPGRVPADAPMPKWSITIDASSRHFDVDRIVRRIAPDNVEVALRFRPDPQPGDFIEFTRNFQSMYLNPVTKADLPPGVSAALQIGGRDYTVYDGLVLVERTLKAHIHYNFPASYGLRPDDIAVFVASHSSTIDYLAPWELKKVSADVESFGPKLMANIRVVEPLPRHLYGAAWSPPQ